MPSENKKRDAHQVDVPLVCAFFGPYRSNVRVLLGHEHLHDLALTAHRQLYEIDA